ncbi:transposase [Bifidobacterium longum subsp. longum]|jgi:hypothetical protein|nr:transposase [Bifidobacterium longum subsp. longum]
MSLRAHALQTESRTAHRSIGTSQKGTGLLNLILIKTGTNMFAVLNVKTRARGFKNMGYFSTMIYLTCGKLDLSTVTT